MGLDIGIISISYLERPQGEAYEFAWALAIEASGSGYMYGEGNNWAPFTQRRVLRMLDEFAERNGLDQSGRTQILQWLQSLPWDGWRDDLDLSTAAADDDEDDFSPVLDGSSDRDGGLIELHFDW
jgi:hypothetical protein